MPELLMVLAFIGLVALVSAMGFIRMRGKTETMTAARLMKLSLHQARMQAIYRGISHFVVLDPDSMTLEIYADTGSQVNEFDVADERVFGTHLPGVSLTLPSEPATLTTPDSGATITTAWGLPDPASGGAWGTNRKGVMFTAAGRLQSAESTPSAISTGTIIFADSKNHATAVSIRGSIGSFRSFQYRDGAWKEL